MKNSRSKTIVCGAFAALFISASDAAYAAEKVPAGESCDKLDGLSVGFIETFADIFKTSASDVYIVSKRRSADGKYCEFNVNTNSGVRECSDYQLFKLDNGRIIAHLFGGFYGVSCQ